MAELAKPDNYLDSQAKQVLRQLVAEMSNEMRTQIARILAYSQVMLEPEEVGTLNEEQRKYLTTIYQAGQNLLKILDDSVDTLYLAVGRLHLEIAEVDLNHFLGEVISAAPDRIQQNIQSNLPVIWADRLRVQQAVTMILSRVVYAASPRNESTVKLTICCDDNWVMFNITTIGREKLYYYDDSNDPTLFLSRSIIEMHGGQMQVKVQEELKKLEISFTLPIQQNKPVDKEMV